MYHDWPGGASFWLFLFSVDQDLAQNARQRGCSCGGRLHRADYPRKPRGSDERHGKRTYVSEFGMERARRLAAESHRTAREALAEAASAGANPQAPGAEAELEQIADFIYTRTS